MKIICKEHAESKCDCYPYHCYGCNAFENPTNFDRIKHSILKMNMEEFIEFCGGDSAENIICGQITASHAHCANTKKLFEFDCGDCIREYLKKKPD